MLRTPWPTWSCVSLAALLFSCGRTELGDGVGFVGFGGAAAGTLVTSGDASVGGQGPGSGGSGNFGPSSAIGSSSVSTNATSTVVGTTLSTSGISTDGSSGSFGGSSSTDGQLTATTGSGGAGGAGGAHTWGEPVLLDPDVPGGTWQPQIAMNNDGAAVVTMVQPLTDSSSVWAVRYTPDAGWSDTELLATDDTQLLGAQVAIDDEGTAVVVWQSPEPGANLWSRRYGGGSGWEAPEVVNPDGVLQGHNIGVAMDATGTTLAVWRESDGTNSQLWSNRHTPDAGWGDAVAIQETVNPFSVGFVMNGSGNAIAIWPQWDDAGQSVWSSRSEVGLNWTPPQAVRSGFSDTGQDPDVAVDPEGNGMAVWHQLSDSGSHVWANRFVAGVDWDTAEILDTAPLRAQDARVGMDNDGSAVAVWVQSDGTTTLWSNRYTPDSGWGEAEPISSAAAAMYRPVLAVGSAGDAVAAWTQLDDDGGVTVWSNRYLPDVGWLEPEFVDVASPGTSVAVDVDIDGDGNAIAVWSHSDDVPFDLWANHSSRPE